MGGSDGAFQDRLPRGVELAVQPRADGTGGAVLYAAADHLDTHAPVLVINGDVPLVTAEALSALLADHAAGGAAATIVSMMLDDPAGYGRVIRGPGDTVERVVETKSSGDASADELAIAEVNAGIYAFDGRALLDALRRVGTDNAQGEIYLPAVLEVLRAGGARVGVHRVQDEGLVLGVNDGSSWRACARSPSGASRRRTCAPG